MDPLVGPILAARKERWTSSTLFPFLAKFNSGSSNGRTPRLSEFCDLTLRRTSKITWRGFQSSIWRLCAQVERLRRRIGIQSTSRSMPKDGDAGRQDRDAEAAVPPR